MLETGENAPIFELPRDGGGTIGLEALSGNNVVLFFYPKDNTPGCTKESIEFSTKIEDFAAANTIVIGISKDSVKKHNNFVTKRDLKVILASDADSDVCERYGVWLEKSMFGKKYMGIERSTFLIGIDGKIKNIWRKVKVSGHVEDVLKMAKNL